jgi:hypothetical protein
MSRPRPPRQLSDIALNEVSETEKVVRNEVEWPTNEDGETVNFAGFRYVLHDRLRPRHFSTLGNKILIESPTDAVLVGDKMAFLNHNNYLHMVTDFIKWSQERIQTLEKRVLELERLTQGMMTDGP